MFEEGAALRKIHGDKNVFDFTLGNPAAEPPAIFHRELRRLAENPEPGMHRYMSNAGYEETRQAVAEILSERSSKQVTAAQVVMTCGAGGALNVVLKTILNPGEEIIVLSPYFVEYFFYIDNHGGVPHPVATDPQTFRPDLAAIDAAISEKTRAIIVNSPNNPTGVVYPRTTLEKLGALIARKEKELAKTIYVISDEPYAGIIYDRREVPSLFDCVRNAVVVTSHSKDLALPGERIGYLAASPDMEDAGKFIEGAVFCNRILGFVNAPALIQRLVTGLQHETVNIAEYQEKRDLLYNHLRGLGFSMVKPDGAFYLFPRSPLEDDVEFVRTAQKYRILVVPGTGFGAPGFFRIAYCMEKEIIERSLPAWRELAQDLGLT
jgi:aspartate aminotransferase